MTLVVLPMRLLLAGRRNASAFLVCQEKEKCFRVSRVYQNGKNMKRDQTNAGFQLMFRIQALFGKDGVCFSLIRL